jgi:hypothetical protein
LARPIVAPRSRDYGDIGLWLGLLVESDRGLHSDHPATTKSFSQRVLCEAHRCRVRTVLGLGDNQLSADQLDSIAGLEKATFDEPLVLDPRPSTEAEIEVGHDARLNVGTSGRQCLRW